ncbi:hypothetical protein [Micromonospora craterilacus]|uniref:hypothetical protein n=1 Tax=Micromonospora craterilacus TaxID=1655439 RepID=UPI0011B7F110|nr:hypothetical protein [Micromonospora craterilacus]
MTDFRPPWARRMDALLGIPVCLDPDQPAGTARFEVDPEEPRHITRIWSAARDPAEVKFTDEQTEQIRDHYRAMDERAARLLIDYQRLLAQLGPPLPAEMEDPLCACSHAALTTGSHLLSYHPFGGRCSGLDSYGLPCQCPSFELHEETQEMINER